MDPSSGGTLMSTGTLLATMPNKNVLLSCIKWEMGSLTVFHIAVYNLKGDGMFDGGVSRYSELIEKGLHLVPWGVSDAFCNGE